jgi:hypothetical protein
MITVRALLATAVIMDARNECGRDRALQAFFVSFAPPFVSFVFRHEEHEGEHEGHEGILQGSPCSMSRPRIALRPIRATRSMDTKSA